jgi:hypothetical protein
MRRSPCGRSIVLVLFLGLIAVTGAGAVRAQEATPAAEAPMETDPEGVSFDLLTLASGVALPDPADMVVVRIGLEPGASDVFDATDPAGGILLVESGAITVRVSQPWTVTRGEGLLAAMIAAEEAGDMSGVWEAIAPGVEATLEAGDAAYIPGNVDGELRNDGDEPATGIGFLIGPTGDLMEE